MTQIRSKFQTTPLKSPSMLFRQITNTVLWVGCFLLVGCTAKQVMAPANLNNSQNQPIGTRVSSSSNTIRFGTFVTPSYTLLPQRSWILVAPPGNFTWSINRLRMNNMDAPGFTEARSNKEMLDLTKLISLDGLLTVEELGVWRNYRLLKVVANPETPLNISQNEKPYRHRMVEFDLTISFTNVPATSAFQAENAQQQITPEISEFLAAQVANPEGIKQYAQKTLPPSPNLHPENLVPETPWGTTGIPAEQWRAIHLTKDGLFSLDGSWLAENGFQPTEATPERLLVYSRGKAVPLFLIGGDATSTFATGGRVAFWGEQSDSPETNARVYYVAVAADSSRSLLQLEPAATPPDSSKNVAQVFQRTMLLQEDNTLEKRLGNFLTVKDMTWVWAPLTPAAPTTYSFNLPGLPTVVPEAQANLKFYQSVSGLASFANLEYSINGVAVQTAQLNPGDTEAQLAIPANVLKRSGNTLAIRCVDEKPTPSLSTVYLDSIQLTHESLFRGDEGILQFTVPEMEPALLQLSNFRFLQTRVINLSNPEEPRFQPLSTTATEGYIIPPFAKGDTLLVFEQDRVERAPAGQAVELPQTLEVRTTQVLIVAHPLFISEATRLAESFNAKTSPSSPAAIVMNSDSLYHAKSGGELSSEGIRAYLADLIHTPAGEALQYVILFGDCTSDGQRITKNNVHNFIPTYSYQGKSDKRIDPYACDAYYGWLSGDDQVADVFVSRISVNNPVDAAAYVDKAIEHDLLSLERSTTNWENKVFMLSDSEEFSPAAENLLKDFAPRFTVDHVRSYDAIWEDNYYLPASVLVEAIAKVSPVLTKRIADEFNRGVGNIIYLGHGSPNIWSNQRIWFGGDSPSSDNLLLHNAGKYPFVATFTCNNGAIDYPIPLWNVTIIEDMVRQKNAGAIAAFIPSGPGFTRNHMGLLQGLVRQLNQTEQSTYAMLAEAARLNYQANFGEDDHSRMYLLLGAGNLHQPMQAEFNTLIETIENQYTKSLELLHVQAGETTGTLTLTLRNENPSGVDVQVFVEAAPLETAFIQPYATQEVSVTLPQELNSAVIRGEIKNPLNPLYFQHSLNHSEVLPKQILTIVPARSKGLSPEVMITLTNPFAVQMNYFLKVQLLGQTPEAEEVKSSPLILQPYEEAQISQPIKLSNEVKSPVQVRVTAYKTLEGDGPILLQTRDLSIAQSQLPDLAFVADSITFSPKNPTVGATIFVEGFVENRSSVASPPSRIGLFLQDKPEEELSSKTPHPLAKLAHILPGEKGFFRTRWDPPSRAGSMNLEVRLDPENLLVETNRENNSVTLPVNIRTKWDLVPAGIGLRPLEEQGFVELAATVKNIGESDAHEVVVLFYYSEEQTEKTLIGQAPVDVVPAAEERIAILKWDVRTLQNPQQVKPSFAISLRGSRQRISSVTE